MTADRDLYLTIEPVRRRQTVERKARFIAQLKTGNTEDRTVADLGGDDLGNAAAATKAVATGDVRYVEQVSLEDDVKRLSAMVRAHSDAKARNAAERRSVAREVTACEEQMVELDRALPGLAANGSAPFAMRVRGKTYRERAEAAPVLVDSLRHAYVEGKRYGNTKEFPIAELRGFQVRASRMLSSDEMIVTLRGWRRGPRWRGRPSRRTWRWRGCGCRSLRAWPGTGC